MPNSEGADDEIGSEATQVINAQRSLLASIQKTQANFSKDSSSRKTAVAYFDIRMENLRKFYDEFRENHRVLVRHSALPLVQKNYFQAGGDETFEEACIECFTRIQAARDELVKKLALTNRPSTSSASTGTSPVISNELPLPEVKLPTFDGNYIDWPAFKAVFVSRVHESNQLNDLQRFHHLRGSLAGDAADDIQHLALIEENYRVAWKLLTSLYENKKILFMHYMELFDKLRVVNKNEPSSLKRFLQTCRSCVSSIKSLGIDLSTQSHILTFYMLKKLPKEIKIDWERSQATKKSVPEFEELCSNLDEQYQVLITSTSSQSSSRSSSSKVEPNRRKADSNKREIKSHLVTNESASSKCPHCKVEDHPVRQCPSFLQLGTTERKTIVEKLKLCFNCLGANHTLAKCSSKRNCSICGARHHSLIHIIKPNPSGSVPSSSRSTESSTQSAVSITAMHVAIKSPLDGIVVLPTALIIVHDSQGGQHTLRALIDQGSQRSFITERAVQTLRLSKRKFTVSITGLEQNSASESHHFVTLTIGSRFDHATRFSLNAFVMKRITGKLPDERLNIDSWSHIQNVQLADPNFHIPSHVDLLIGSDLFYVIIQGQVERLNDELPIAQNTIFGWIVSGKQADDSDSVTVTSMHNQIGESYSSTHDLLQRFWEIEEFGADEEVTSEDLACESFFRETHYRNADGKYIVRLPFKTSSNQQQVIGASRNIALNRFLKLERRFENNPQLRQAYVDTIDEYFRLGQMHPVTTSENEHRTITNGSESFSCCYLPHHAITKESSTTTKTRVVFDASAKTANGKSLNNILMVGPTLHNDLLAILLNWRFKRFAFMADIEKMYL